MDIAKHLAAHPVVVAPMAGVTDKAYRQILASFSKGLLYTEMVSDKGLQYRNDRTLEMLKVDKEEGNVVLQLFGSDPKAMGEAARLACSRSRAVALDLNMGCPVEKVVRKNGGAALMRDKETARKVLRALVENADRPVTVKMRSGWDFDSINAPEIARIAEEEGAAAVAVHGRTRSQMYRGTTDHGVIREVVRAVGIPVIGNGDIQSPEDARRMIENTGVEAVMVGRALWGDPWLLGRIDAYLRGSKPPPPPALEARLALIKRHAQLLSKEKGENVAVREMRAHVPRYFKGQPGSAPYKRHMNRIETLAELDELLKAYQRGNPPGS